MSLRRDHERSVRAADPWSLFRNSDRWRRNPLIDDGHYFTHRPQVDFDTRNERDLPTTGWCLRGRYEHATSDDVAPVLLPESVRPELPTGGGYAFDRLLLDFRRYSRLTPSLRVNARLRADGWIGGDRLPIQRRVSLGGPDLLPGYDFRAFTCAPRGSSTPPQPALCDRSIAAQVEVRTRLGLNLGYPAAVTPEARTGRFIGIEEADLVFLSDAGKAWLAGDGPGQVPVNRIPRSDEWKADVGVGLDAGADRRVPRQEPRRGRAGEVHRETAAPLLVPPLRRLPVTRAGRRLAVALGRCSLSAAGRSPAQAAAGGASRRHAWRPTPLRRGLAAPVVRSENLLDDGRWLSALRSGLPVRLH